MRASVWAFSFALLASVMVQPGRGQVVIATHAGLIHFFEGAVYLGDQPLEAHFGKYTSIPERGELRTERGRAEVLLTPGAFLRVGENARIRMVANALADTRVEVLAGSAIVDTVEPAAGTSVTLTHQGWQLRPLGKGVFRLDCNPPRLSVRAGAVEVSTADDEDPVIVTQGMELPLTTVLVPEKASRQSGDAFSDWANGRAESILADNAIASNIQDPGSISASDFPVDGLTYFPMLGVPFYGSSLSAYDVSGSYPYPSGLSGVSPLYQPGFYSIYLPGYSRSPLLLLGLRGLGLQHPGLPPSRGILPPISAPRSPVSHPAPLHPVAPHGGAHIGGHR